MDYIEGRTLADVLSESAEALPEERVLRWAVQICDALAYLHSKTPPIIHRNIKPKNIILESGENERVRLVGFGLARYYVDGLDHDEEFFGTKGFSPPEQYGAAQTDARSDIFSLGATIFALLTKADTDQFIQDIDSEHISLGFPEIDALNPKISPAASQVVRKALNASPADRFQSADEMKSTILQRTVPGNGTEEYRSIRIKPACDIGRDKILRVQGGKRRSPCQGYLADSRPVRGGLSEQRRRPHLLGNPRFRSGGGWRKGQLPQP